MSTWLDEFEWCCPLCLFTVTTSDLELLVASVDKHAHLHEENLLAGLNVLLKGDAQ